MLCSRLPNVIGSDVEVHNCRGVPQHLRHLDGTRIANLVLLKVDVKQSSSSYEAAKAAQCLEADPRVAEVYSTVLAALLDLLQKLR